jgi:hypothetical protein
MSDAHTQHSSWVISNEGNGKQEAASLKTEHISPAGALGDGRAHKGQGGCRRRAHHPCRDAVDVMLLLLNEVETERERKKQRERERKRNE